MTSYENLQQLGKQLFELTSKMKNEKLSETELQDMEDVTRALYERVLILNYKAKEEKVFGAKEETSEIIIEEEKNELNSEYIEQEKSPEIITVDKLKHEPAAFSFDFSGDFDASKKDIDEVETTINSNVETPLNVSQSKELEGETLENNPTDSNSYFQQFYKAYEEIASNKLNNAKLDSLEGAIGLNDRLLFVRELFQNSADDLDQTLSELNHCGNIEVALKKLSKIATEKSWEKDSKTVAEFAHLINRRYAL